MDGYDGELRITVTQRRAPADGEPAYVVGPYPGSGLERGEYLGLVTLNLPEAADERRASTGSTSSPSSAVTAPTARSRPGCRWQRGTVDRAGRSLPSPRPR